MQYGKHTYIAFCLSALAVVASCGDPEGASEHTGEQCEAGSLGCACASGDTCGTNARGESLVCHEGTCEPAGCMSGERGCVCRAGTLCDDSADACVAGVCKPTGCRAGELDCDCLLGTCGAGLYCDLTLGEGTCVDDSGFPGGECLANGLCHDQSRCDRNTDTCVRCDPGSQGCVPDRGTCNAGLVRVAGRCLARNEVPPDAPECYTRCENDLVRGGTVRTCDADGFMEGCLTGYTCTLGSCVPAGETPETCTEDAECPDHQACLSDGHCYSNCSDTLACPMGLTCDDHVCRIPCERTMGATGSCPEGTRCDMEDGETGTCVPLALAEPEALPPSRVTTTFEVSPTTASLSMIAPEITLGLTHTSTLGERFEVRKLSHRAFGADGNVIADPRSEAEPLWFLGLSGPGTSPIPGGVTVSAPARCTTDCPRVRVRLAMQMPPQWRSWHGTVEVRHPTMGAQIVQLSFQASVGGRWVGRMHYFASFPDGGLDAWRVSDQKDDARSVANGLIRQWAAYRKGRLHGFDEMLAILQTTTIGSWRWPNVDEACDRGWGAPGDSDPPVACYLFDGSLTSRPPLFVNNIRSEPLPTGATEYPIALNLEPRLNAMNQFELAGAIDSGVALHYAGTPAVSMTFGTSPNDLAACANDGVSTECVSYLTAFSSDISVGGRRNPLANGTCPAGYERTTTPWYVPGFDRASQTGFRTECRELGLPFAGAANTARNTNLTLANPVLDGHAIERHLSLVDGAMIDQSRMIVFFEESFDASIRVRPNQTSVKAYGVMVLDRVPQTLAPADFIGSVPGEPTSPVTPWAGATSCEAAQTFARANVGSTYELPSNALARAQLMLTGVRTGAGGAPLDGETVHYLCVDTGLIDGGPSDTGDAGVKEACPIESNVRYFSLPRTMTQQNVADLACQDTRTCAQQLATWERSSLVGHPEFKVDLIWTCGVPGLCTENLYNRRKDKLFYARGPGNVIFSPLAETIAQAFRYKTRFLSRSGSSVGFAPEVCAGSGALTPYCYDPVAIEEIKARVDCMLAAYTSEPTQYVNDDWRPIRSFLSSNLGRYPGSTDPNAPPPPEGFEDLYAELLVMLGDEAVTDALRTRFDLAATNGASFLGAQMEPSGINLSGISGYEMRMLHQAAQYYDLATQRFFGSLAPVVFAALGRSDYGESGEALVSRALVSEYLERLIGGSTKKADVWSQIATRYQSFNRPDLARSVLQRAYTATYLESVMLARFMVDIASSSQSWDRDGILRSIEQAQTKYQSALARMREVYETIDAGGDRFGFSPDFIPFPAVDDNDTRYSNSFETVLGLARLRTDTARRFEQDAIDTGRAFETDDASFQSELVQISVSHDQRLTEICGTFEGRDGRVYPATRANAYLSDRTALLGDPCGLTQSGAIHAKLGEIRLLANEVTENLRLQREIKSRIAHENTRVNEQCGRIYDLRDTRIAEMGTRLTLQNQIDRMEYGIATAQRVVNNAMQLEQALSAGCSNMTSFISCARSGIAVGVLAIGFVASEITTQVLQEQIIGARQGLAASNVRDTFHEAASECESFEIEGRHNVYEIGRDALKLEHEALQLSLKAQILGADIAALRQEAQRVEQLESEAEQLAINVQAARNDPNVRVYMNTAMINADRSFHRALEHAYRATRILEYYTSQSYPHAGDLYLIRMVSRGEHNLDNYLDELEDEYESFRVEFRTRSRRAVRLSLRDDILRIPYSEGDGTHRVELDDTARSVRMQEMLLDPSRLDANGHRSIEFRTSLDQFSPCTFGHQIDYIEVMFSGGNLGDFNANVMLWQEGTGVVARSDQGTNFHRLPPALIVATPRFDNATPFDPSVYRNYGMRDRPLINTSWRLVFDHLNPQNRDVDLHELSDLYVYIYYTDFTNPAACR